jgi:hypothetical protein
MNYSGLRAKTDEAALLGYFRAQWRLCVCGSSCIKKEMNMQTGYSSAWLVLLLACTTLQADPHKQIVGATEVISIAEAEMDFKARVDTGARTSSVHAEAIMVDTSDNPQGQPISFLLVNKSGQSRKIETRVASVVNVKTSEGSEIRYKVPLTLIWNDSSKTVLLTLNDRKAMRYRLLLGRNWLHGDFIVDVDKNNKE